MRVHCNFAVNPGNAGIWKTTSKLLTKGPYYLFAQRGLIFITDLNILMIKIAVPTSKILITFIKSDSNLGVTFDKGYKLETSLTFLLLSTGVVFVLFYIYLIVPHTPVFLSRSR